MNREFLQECILQIINDKDETLSLLAIESLAEWVDDNFNIAEIK